MMLQAHYRSPINYSYDVIEQCRAALERLYTCRDNLDFAAAHVADAATDGEEAFRAQVDTRRDAFIAAMDDDLNTADAIAALFELVRDANTFFTVPRSKEITAYTTKCFDELTDVLGLLYNRKKQSLDERVEALIEERQAARKAKNFKRADEIRDELKAEGIVLEDTPQGVKWRRA
jgi:cysteinyl-tRNA synthetase